MVGELNSFVGNAAFLSQFGGDYELSKVVSSENSGVVLLGTATTSNNSGGYRFEFALDDCYVRLYTRDGQVHVIGGSLSPLPVLISSLVQY